MVKIHFWPKFRGMTGESPRGHRRSDVNLLLLALLTPWVFLALGFILRWFSDPLWTLGALLGAMDMAFAWFGYGLWRLISRAPYRRSLFGWFWTLCAFGNLWVIVLIERWMFPWYP
jgi:hypothetical protein